MKVLMLIHGLPVGGTEVMVCHLVRYLRRFSVDVEVGCLDEIGELGEGLIAEGVPFREYHRKGGFDLSLARQIADHARSTQCDLIHAHQYTCYFYGALAQRRARMPLVFSEHGRFYPDLPSWKRRLFNRLLGSRAHAITAVSAGVKRSLVEIEGFPADRIEVLYNGIDFQPFVEASKLYRDEARERVGLPYDATVIGTIGRLDSIKNQTFLLHAFAKLHAEDADTRLAVVGYGPERELLEKRAADLGVADAVHFFGKRSDTPELLAAFSVFALTSLSEGTPMTLLEAMAASRPIVSTGVGGIPEIVEHEKTGLLVEGVPPDYRNPDAVESPEYLECFTAALSRALYDVDFQREIVRNAYELGRGRFSLDIVCRRYVEIYEAVSGKTAGPERLPLESPSVKG